MTCKGFDAVCAELAIRMEIVTHLKNISFHEYMRSLHITPFWEKVIYVSNKYEKSHEEVINRITEIHTTLE